MDNIVLEDTASTPLNDEEKKGLKLDWVTTRAELNASEHKNIQKAEEWAWDRKHKTILTETFIKKLHKRMFDSVWKESVKNSV